MKIINKSISIILAVSTIMLVFFFNNNIVYADVNDDSNSSLLDAIDNYDDRLSTYQYDAEAAAAAAVADAENSNNRTKQEEMAEIIIPIILFIILVGGTAFLIYKAIARKIKKRRFLMYCKKCGIQIENNALICPNCGASTNDEVATQSSQITTGGSKIAMVVVFILTIIVALSPFVKMYYIDFFEQKDFSVSGMLETTSEILDFGNSVGVEFHLSDVKIDEMSDVAKVVFFVVIFDMLMFVIGFAELFVELVYIVSAKDGSEGKFWKATISSALAFFIANLIIFLVILLINVNVNEGLGEYSSGNIKVMGVHIMHYVFQIIAAISYFISHAKYSAWKKTRKNT